MTNKIFVENVRKIAKTEEILKRLTNSLAEQDKSKIRGGRGVGFATTPYSPCQLLYANTDGVYTFADLVDGIEGPRIQDGGYSHCTQVNTINGMRETGVSPTLPLTLKPDGVFLPSNGGYYYTSEYLIQIWNGGMGGYTYSPANWFFNSLEETQATIITALAANQPANDPPHTLTLITDITDVDIDSHHWVNTYPLYYFDGSADGITDTIVGVPSNYDFTIDTFSTGDPGILEYPTLFSDHTFAGMGYFSGLTTPTAAGFQLAIDIGVTNLWKPNPAETTAPIKYYHGISIVTFDFGASYSRKGMVRPGKDGGFVIFELSGASPTGNAYIYRRDRTLTNVVPVAQMTPYLA